MARKKKAPKKKAPKAKSDAKLVGKARAVRRGTDVSRERKIDIGPPNSRDTW